MPDRYGQAVGVIEILRFLEERNRDCPFVQFRRKDGVMMVAGNWKLSADGTYTFETRCLLCAKPSSLEGLDWEDVHHWEMGAHVDHAFPRLTPAERRVLTLGSHPRCFDKAFPGGLG